MHVLHVILWLVLMCDSDYSNAAAVKGTSGACARGYHGSECIMNCPKNCFNNKCRMDGTCHICTDGFHGPDCSKSCSSSCYNKTCNIYGICASCLAGFYGNKCNIPCHKNCLTCVSATQCSECKPGFHGEDCRSRCPSNCINCTNEGYCGLCKQGYRGNTCNETCLLCKNGTACRQRDGYCEQSCKDGYTSENCSQKCHTNCGTCLRNKTTSCTECAVGRFGEWHTPQYNLHVSNCLNKCSFNCLGGLCNESTGHCFDCTVNFQGDRCEKCRKPLANPGKNCECRTDLCLGESSCFSCSNATWYPDFLSRSCCPCSNTCWNSTCDGEDVCTHGCIDGYYGDGCRNKCSDKQTDCEKCSNVSHKAYFCEKCRSGFYPTKNQCVQCSDFCLNGKCDPTDGRCLDGCIKGRWGVKCDWKCGQFCNGGMCDRDNGHCSAECVSGHWGEKCNGTCVKHCDFCENEIECIRCEPGRYLSNCSGQCSKGCAMVNGKLECDIYDGSCRDGCLNERFRGKQCAFDCSDKCTGSECDMLTGKCRRGCETGLYGEFCNSTCADTCLAVQQGPTCFDTNGTCIAGCMNGYYGDTCRDECHKNCVNGTCNQDSGSCLFACLPGHLGANCSIAVLATGLDDNLLSQVVPVIVALLLVVLLAVVVIRNKRLLKRVKRERHLLRDNDAMSHEEPMPLAHLSVDHPTTNDNEIVYANTAGLSTKIPVTGLLDYVVNRKREDLANIFQTLPQGLIKPYQDSQKPENLPRNRYKTIYPYDFSRVRLTEGSNDYINASFIDGYSRKMEYIASLGPFAKTTEKFAIFWQMIWEQNVEKIVMLTNLQEPSGIKCEQYWPDAGTTVNYDVISVYGRNDDVYADYIIRYLMVKKGDETREMYHLHYIAWPDKTIPYDVISLLDFRHVTSGLPTKLGGPTVVHCSAGIGRTGTYIGLDILCKQTEQEDSIDVYDCVMTMRENRVGMVQTAEQYMFLHRALAVYVTLGYQPIRSECFSEYVSILDDEKLQGMFAKLEACRKLIEEETAAIARNKRMGNNRDHADIPGDKYRVRPHQERQFGASSDYVNAVYMNSYAATNRYIMAQTPVQGGEEEFLALLLQKRCSIIVDLDPVTSSDDLWASLLDNKKRSKVNNFQISSSQMTNSQKFLKRHLRLSVDGQTAVKELNVSLYQFQEWEKDAAVPESPEDFVEFIRDVEDAARTSPENGPILLHCGTAGERSCLFYVVAMAIQRLETEHEVGVVSTVHQTRTRRRGAIPNKEQLKFCYQCVNAYLQTFQTDILYVALYSDYSSETNCLGVSPTCSTASARGCVC